jgi:NAD+ kinase
MQRQFQTIALTGKTADPRIADSMCTLAAHLRASKRGVIAEENVAAELDSGDIESLPLAKLVGVADLMIAVGGDGTMLFATRLVAEHGVPLLGINRGRLGFLADVGSSEMLQGVDEVLDGKYVEETRLMLVAEVDGQEGNGTMTALNDIVVEKKGTGRMVDLETWIDGVYVNTHEGDGLVVATPTGSTAYALSGGGPILHPNMNAFVLVPICPHTLSDRPLVVRGDRSIEIRMIERGDARSAISCDGRHFSDLSPDQTLRVSRSGFAATLIHPEGYDYFRILRSKLNWGRGSRSRVSQTGTD